MMSRVNKILVLLLISQLFLIAYVYRPNQSSGPPTVHFFTDVDAGQVVGLTIADKSQSVAMKKEGDIWRLSADPAYPADTKKVEMLVKKLLTLTSSRLVTRTISSHNRLQVAEDDFNRKLTLTLKDGETRQLLLGTSPNYKTTHVRAADDDNVYLVKDLAAWEAAVTPDDWWDNNYLDVQPAELKKVILQNSHGRIELSRDRDNKWQAVGMVAGKELADEALNHFLDKACLVQLSSYLGRDLSDQKFGLDKPLADLEIVTAEGSIRLKVAAAGDDKKDEYVAKVSDSPFYVTVHGYEINPILDTSLNKLLVDKKDGEVAKE